MDYPDSTERRHAARAGSAEDAERLLADPAWTVREAAAERLTGVARDSTAFAKLVAMTLADPVPLARAACARALADSARTADYADAARHNFERQRVRAADALGWLGDATSKKLLAQLATDPHAKVRRAALLALARKPPSQLGGTQELAARKSRERDPAVRLAAERLMRRILDEEPQKSAAGAESHRHSPLAVGSLLVSRPAARTSFPRDRLLQNARGRNCTAIADMMCRSLTR